MVDNQDGDSLKGSLHREENGEPHSCCGGGYFEIHVKGHLDTNWKDWFEGMEIKLLENGEMVLSGAI
ncbi:MAG: hypothetical protein EHM70_04960, partial [Chloroflexota bacterium]